MALYLLISWHILKRHWAGSCVWVIAVKANFASEFMFSWLLCLFCQHLCSANNSRLILICPSVCVSYHTQTQTYWQNWLKDATTFTEWAGDMSLLHFPHLICPWNCHLKLTSDQHLHPLLLPLPPTAHPLSDTQLRSSYQPPTSPDGPYRWPVLSTARPQGLSFSIF